MAEMYSKQSPPPLLAALPAPPLAALLGFDALLDSRGSHAFASIMIRAYFAIIKE
jgi:hypothetical protein